MDRPFLVWQQLLIDRQVQHGLSARQQDLPEERAFERQDAGFDGMTWPLIQSRRIE